MEGAKLNKKYLTIIPHYPNNLNKLGLVFYPFPTKGPDLVGIPPASSKYDLSYISGGKQERKEEALIQFY